MMTRNRFLYSMRVPFSDTDLAGVVHFSNFFRYIENCEHAFFRSLGFSIDGPIEKDLLGWPRISAACEYYRPARFEDRLMVELLVKRIGNKTLTYFFRVWPAISQVDGDSDGRQDQGYDASGGPLAVGKIVAVCALRQPGAERPFIPSSIPPALREKISEAPLKRYADHLPKGW